jgi:hypothetical protein
MLSIRAAFFHMCAPSAACLDLPLKTFSVKKYALKISEKEFQSGSTFQRRAHASAACAVG